jgi:hypothetical protein
MTVRVVAVEEGTTTTRLLPGLRLVPGDRHGAVHGVLTGPAPRALGNLSPVILAQGYQAFQLTTMSAPL